MKVGDRVRHRTRHWTGEVVSHFGWPLIIGAERRVMVRVGAGPSAVEHTCWSGDLELVAPIAPMTPPVDLPPSGAVRDAVEAAVVERLRERRPGWRNVRPGLAVIDGGRP